MSYGAVGDGVADDTAAIQAALDNHRVVFFPKPKWRYKVTSSLKINNYTMIYGEQCFLDQNTLNNQTVYYAGTDCLFTTTSTDPGSGVCIQMRNVSVEGNNSTNVAMTSAIQRLSVKNCLFRHFDIGIDLTAYAVSDVVETVISECYFIQCNTGIRSTSTSGKHNTDGILSNCFFSNCITGINLDTAPGWLIQGNHFYGLGVSQQHIVISGYLLKILGNYIEPANQRGIVYKMTEGNGVCNAIIADNLVMVKSGEVGITLMSLVGEADGLIVADNVINSGTGLTTGSIGVSVEGSFRVYGTLLNNDINNVETKVSTGALGSIRSGGFEIIITNSGGQMALSFQMVLVCLNILVSQRQCNHSGAKGLFIIKLAGQLTILGVGSIGSI
ncbi:glycosyl hydrolase family 28-related protein [Pseudarcicella hirudinis]|uniref:glycosyl hydrolase family 28-related protein n=1 Tax=Pseudarcicella hirudinis TaxID=1079859 RepID=UPI0035F05D7F